MKKTKPKHQLTETELKVRILLLMWMMRRCDNNSTLKIKMTPKQRLVLEASTEQLSLCINQLMEALDL